MGSSHGGTRDGSGAAADPGGENVGTGGKDVQNAAVVGEAGASVVAVSGTNSADGGLRSRGVVASVSVVVASSDGDHDTRLLEVGSGAVHGRGVATTNGHGGNDTVGAVAVAVVVGDKVHTRDDGGVLARALVVEDLDTKDLGLLGDTVGPGANGTGAVSAVAVAIAAGGVVRLDHLGAALKLGVRCLDTGVDDVDASTLAGRVVVSVRGSTGAGAGDASKTPGSVALLSVDVDDSILLNVLDLKARC